MYLFVVVELIRHKHLESTTVSRFWLPTRWGGVAATGQTRSRSALREVWRVRKGQSAFCTSQESIIFWRMSRGGTRGQKRGRKLCYTNWKQSSGGCEKCVRLLNDRSNILADFRTYKEYFSQRMNSNILVGPDACQTVNEHEKYLSENRMCWN